MLRASVFAAGFAACLAASSAQAQIVLKASQQFPGGKGDVRDEMVQISAREVEKANVGLKIQVFPGESLFKATEQCTRCRSSGDRKRSRFFTGKCSMPKAG